jgi:hypothetical protein
MKTILVLCMVALMSACGQAAAPSAALRVEGAWASPTPGGVNVSAGYMTIVNDGASEDILISAYSARAANVEIHSMTMQGAVMQMRPMGTLVIPAHQRVALAPNGLHLMFTGVTQPFAEGERIPVRLMFEHAGLISLDLPVSRAAPAG